MKLGCIFKSLALIIVFLGTSFYLYNKYGKDMIELGAAKAKEAATNKIEKMVEDFEARDVSPKVEERFQELLEELEKKKESFSSEDFDKIFSKLNGIIEENKFDDKTFDDLEKLIREKGKRLKEAL